MVAGLVDFLSLIVVGGGQAKMFINIINNNVNASSIKTIGNLVSIQCLYCLHVHVVEGLGLMGFVFAFKMLDASC